MDYLYVEKQLCYQADLDDFFRLVDKSLISDNENQQHRLVTILEAYQYELDRLRQIIRTNDDTVLIFFFFFFVIYFS